MSFAPPMNEAAQRRILLPFTICVIVWGSTWFVITSQLTYVPAIWSITYRFALGTIGMVVVTKVMGAPLLLDRRAHGLAIIVGLSQFVGNYVFVYAAESHMTSGLVALLSALLIVPNAVLGWAFLGQAVSRRFLAGSVIAMIGIAVLFAEELGRATLSAHHIWMGIAFSMSGICSASIANVLQGSQSAKSLSAPTLLTWSMGYGATLDLIAAFVWGGPPHLPLSPIYIAGLLYLALAGSALTFSVYFAMIRSVGPARAGYVAVITPVVAMTLSTLFESYSWTPLGLAGAALALAGLVVAIRARSPAR